MIGKKNQDFEKQKSILENYFFWILKLARNFKNFFEKQNWLLNIHVF